MPTIIYVKTMKEYEKYQLQWMIDHGHSISELIDELDRCQYDWAENNETISDIFSAWENNIGFGGEIWACKPEWEDCEPKEYIEKIYVSEEIEKCLKEPTDESECLDEDETLINTVTFSNGFQMDIKCCGIKYEEGGCNSAWTEAVLFDDKGNELCCTDVCDVYFGEWTLEHGINKYTVIVEKK